MSNRAAVLALANFLTMPGSRTVEVLRGKNRVFLRTYMKHAGSCRQTSHHGSDLDEALLGWLKDEDVSNERD